jgi:hypothetical protein
MLELQAACPSGRNFNGSCFSPVGDVDTPMSLAALDCTVIIAGGPPGVGTLSVQLGSGTPQLGTGWPGMAQGFEFTSVTFQPGNTVTITATYVIDSVTYTGSATYQLPPWCGWVAPTKLLWSGIGWSGSFPVSGEVRVNGLTSVGDAAVPTASAGIMGSVPLYPGGGSEQWVLNVSTPTYPVSVTVSYFWAPGSLTLSGTVTYSSDSAATYSGDVEAG